eukprot:6321008-Prymnesium_polylepis.1
MRRAPTRRAVCQVRHASPTQTLASAVPPRAGPLAFMPFCVVLTGWIAFTAKYVPETKGKSLGQIQDELAAISAGAPPAE